jgi:hypothetical protein
VLIVLTGDVRLFLLRRHFLATVTLRHEFGRPPRLGAAAASLFPEFDETLQLIGAWDVKRVVQRVEESAQLLLIVPAAFTCAMDLLVNHFLRLRLHVNFRGGCFGARADPHHGSASSLGARPQMVLYWRNLKSQSGYVHVPRVIIGFVWSP